MTVVFVIPSLRTGGAERVFANLLSLWDLEKDKVHLVVLTREGAYFETIPPGVFVHVLGKARLVSALPALVRLIRTLSPDAILGTQAHINAALGFLKTWFPHCRVVGRETSMPSQAALAKRSSWLRQLFYRQCYRGLDAVVCPSRAMAQELKSLYGIPSNRLPVIPNPVLFDLLERNSRIGLESVWRAALSSESIWIGAVGRFDPAKGFDDLLRTLALLPPAIRLVLIGDGALRSDLESLVNTLGLRERVVFTGLQTNPSQFLIHCRVFVLSSRYEGQPNAALEALGLGIPVAAFDGPWGCREVVLDGVTGWVAERRDPVCLAQTIEKVLASSWDAESIRSWARERYEGKRIVSRYREVLL